MILFASDLDNTIIHSYKSASEDEICVEMKDNKKLSFVSEFTYEHLNVLYDKICIIPITTRSIEQYKRIKLFKNNKYPKYAVTSNGGILLIDNEIDKNWFNESKLLINSSLNELDKAIEILSNDKNVYFDVRYIDEMFVFTKTKDVIFTSNNLKSKLDLNKVNVYYHNEKMYVIPCILNKGTALKRIKNLLKPEHVICAGDSEFDVSMLELSDMSFVPFKELLISNKNVNCFDGNKRFADFILKEIDLFLKSF